MFFKKCNLFFAFFLVFCPVFSIITDAFNYRLINELLLLFLVLYVIFQLLNLSNIFISKSNQKLFLSKIKKFPVIVSLLILFLTILSCIVNNVFNEYFFVIFSYFCVFICFYSLDKKYYKLLLNSAIVILALSCVLSFIDPRGEFIWGFSAELDFPFSLQFINPNYAGSIIAVIIVVCINFFNLSKKQYENILYGIAFIIFGVYLFLNGSYSPITAMIVAIVFEIIFLWIKNKKCPLKILLLFLCIIPIIFLVDLYPNISELRTCEYNYFLETCAVIDNILGSDILSLFGIDSIIGSDGWDRGSLILESIIACFASLKSFFFGYGAGGAYTYHPHNNYIDVFIEFGFVTFVLYIMLIVYYVYKLIKSRFNMFNFGIVCAIIAYFFRSMFGGIIPIEYLYFLIVFAISANLTVDNSKNKDTTNVENINNNETETINKA